MVDTRADSGSADEGWTNEEYQKALERELCLDDERWHELERDPEVRVGLDEQGAGFFYRPHEIIVHQRDLDPAARQLEGLARLQIARRIDSKVHLRLTSDLDARTAVRSLRAETGGGPVEADLNHVFTLGPRWQFHPATAAWPEEGELAAGPTTKVEREVTVGIVDTGMGPDGNSQPLLSGHFVDDSPDPLVVGGTITSYVGGHGTFVAGLVLQRAPSVRFDPESATFRNGFTDDAAAAADAARLGALGCQVLNLSLGGHTDDGQPPPAITAVVRALAKKGVAVVAAAGNSDTKTPFWPAADESVIGVAAVDRNGAKATFSNFGDWVDACSLGVGVRSTYVKGTLTLPGGEVRTFARTARWSGTSFAAPRVAGAIAALIASGKTSTGREAWDQLRAGAPAGPAGCGTFIA